MSNTKWICDFRPFDKYGTIIEYIHCVSKPGHKSHHVWDYCCVQEKAYWEKFSRKAATIYVNYWVNRSISCIEYEKLRCELERELMYDE